MINEAWHTPDLVCRDGFGSLEADSACYTLGYNSGGTDSSYDIQYRAQWPETEIPLDNVVCGSSSTNFSSCANSSAENCDRTDDVFLTCFTSG